MKKMSKNFVFAYRMEVRDYECDIQGIVNNANYLHYTEHARHAYISSIGVNFDDLHSRGIDVVVANVELRYKRSLRPRDCFEVRLAIEKQGLRYVFYQEVVRLPDEQRVQKDPSYHSEQLSLCAKTDVVALVNGRLTDCEELNEKLGL